MGRSYLMKLIGSQGEGKKDTPDDARPTHLVTKRLREFGVLPATYPRKDAFAHMVLRRGLTDREALRD